VLLDDSDGLIGTVDVRPAVAQPTVAYAPPPAPAVAEPVPAESAVPSHVYDYATEGSEAVEEQPVAEQASAELLPAEPPVSGFVSSVSLGEMESPQMPTGPVELLEPGEFELPGLDALGERETDTDIEEID
jgi:hypothetical protein